MSDPWFKRSYRRMLVDMHIPDWDGAFLSEYDPKRMVELYERARLTSVMFYCQSHVGLCNWPTQTGQVHAAFAGRDVVRELLDELKKRKIAACGYYSVIFNVWAFRAHPLWRMEPCRAAAAEAFASGRMGVCCPNNPEYRAFALAQVEELAQGYDFDGLFFDMIFWPMVCLCPHCRARYFEETRSEIPGTIDWTSPAWCRFQSARERWMDELARDLTRTVKSVKPDLSVYHNFAGALFSWQLGVPFTSAVHHDYLGADFYGGPIEQLVVSKLMLHLTENRPAEFMTSRCITLRDHVRTKPREEMRIQALASTLFSSAFLFIDAIDVRGTVNPAIYDRIGTIYGETAPYEPYLGGEPVEDVAVYFSNESKMDFADNGRPLSDAPGGSNTFPHTRAVRGACAALQKAHIPFGVITRKQLGNLKAYRAVILPNVLRMDEQEAEAFRRYVEGGGRLYASRYSSLTETNGVRHSDFLLSDVFGCHFAADDLGEIAYLKPREPSISTSIAPQDYVSLFTKTRVSSAPSVLRLGEQTEGDVLATLTLPYASPAPGNVFDNHWASFHSSPPWEDTDCPVAVRHDFGRGRAIYCACDIESDEGEASEALFLSLIRSLVDEPWSHEADAHPAVWISAFHQPENDRVVVGFLNYQTQPPPIPLPHVPFTLRPPDGKRFAKLVLLPQETPVAFTADADGALHADAGPLEVFRMVAAYLEDAP